MVRWSLPACILILLLTVFTTCRGGQLKAPKLPIPEKELQDLKNNPNYKDGHLRVRVSQDDVKDLNQHWVDQAFSGLMAAVATDRLRYIPKAEKQAHQQCSKKSETVQEHAKCVTDLLENVDEKRKNRLLRHLGSREKMMSSAVGYHKSSHRLFRDGSAPSDHDLSFWRKSSKSRRPNSKSISKERKSREKRVRKSGERKSRERQQKGEWQGGFRMARAKRDIQVQNQESYNLIGKYDRSPFSLLTKQIANTIRGFKDKKENKNWQTVISDIKKKAEQVKQKKRFEKAIKKKFDVMSEAAKDIAFNEDEEPVKRRREGGHGRSLAMPELDKVEQMIEDEDDKELIREAKKRLSNMTDDEAMKQVPIQIVREVVKLGMSLKGENISNFDTKNVKLISPRLFSVMPEDEAEKKKTINVLSPSLFSIHGGGSELEKKMSLPNLMKGFEDADQQEFLDLIVESTGVGDAMDDAMEQLDKVERDRSIFNLKGPDGQPMYFNKENATKILGQEGHKRIDAFEILQDSVTVEQLSSMNKTGYAIMSKAQREKLYGPDSPYKNDEVLKRTENMTEIEVRRAVRSTIREVAAGRMEFTAREKDIILSPLANVAIINNPAMASQAIILSPVLTSALIGSPAVFGPVILSPWVFIAVIASPRLMCPVVLDPFIGVPIILSPLALTPIILSPGVMNPLVLSPMVLSPFILSPQVLTPVILSPFALSPFILNPAALGPLVLSPFVLSPSIMSPGYVTGVILSPYALSPSINSTGAAVTVFASPGFLS